MLEFIELESENELKEAFPIINDLQPHFSVSDFVKNCIETQTHNRVFAIRQGEKIVSVAAAWLINKSLADKFVWVYLLATEEAHRSKGLGKKLMNYIEEFGRVNGYSEVRVHCSTHLKRSHNFYQRRMRYDRQFFVFRTML